MPRYKVLVLGLDGATFDLILPWVQEGHLPCLGELLRKGTQGRLRSTIPPITPCAWSSFMTGKEPGKHGLFDFVEPAPGGGFRFTNASSRQGETLWGYLSRLGRRVGVVNVPMTYPPEPVNGYLVSGLDTPHDGSRYTYPESLRQELHDQGIGYRIDVQFLGDMRSDRRRDHWLNEFRAIEATRTQALQYLRRRYPADFTMMVYLATDGVQHHFWHYMDPRHDKYDARGAERYRHAIRDVYAHIDGLIASVLKEQDEETVVIIMSDHGFGPTSSVRLRFNQALERKGLLAFRKEGRAGRVVRGLAGRLDGVLRAALSDGMKKRIAARFPRLRVWFERLDEAKIDWERTAAYTNESFRSCPSVWLNRRRPLTEAQIEETLRAAEEALTSLTDPQTGRPVVSRVYRTRELYRGPFAARAPDLIPSWWDDGFLIESSAPGLPPERIVERSTAPLVGGVEFAGSHRLEGVLILAGGPVRPGHILTGARIIDVAPTVLYLMGLPIPGDMDGRPLLEALDPAFVASHPPEIERPGGPAPPPVPETVFTDREAEAVSHRLRQLGYLE